MSNKFPTALNECLGRLKAGDSIESCLERYPEHAKELEPLLETVRFIEPLRFTEPPRPEAEARGRERFLAEAARMRKQQRETDPSLLEQIRTVFARGMSGPVWGRAAAVIVAVLLLFGVVGRVVVQASEDSLPGDPLYSVKQVTRQVQLLTTLNSDAREEKAKQIEAEEREEVRQATEQGRAFQANVAGIIVDWQPGNSIELEDGLNVRVTAATDIDGQPAIGNIATMVVRSEDGRLVAEQITVRPSSTQQAMAAPTETPTVTSTASPMPTDTLRPTDTLAPTKKPPTAVPTKTPTLKPTTTNTPTLQPTPPQGENLGIYELSGAIESISADGTTWVVAGQQIQVTSSTVVKGEPAVGRIAHIRANRLSSGTFVATEIEVEKSSTPAPEKVIVSGVLESQENQNVWYVSGQRIRLDDRSKVVGQMKLGAFVDVEGLRESSTTLYVEKLTVVRTCENTVLLEGTIVSIDAGAGIWIVEVMVERDGQLVPSPFTVRIDGDTQIQNVPVIGATAQLETCRVGDTYTAQRIYVVPTPTPVPPPTDTPTPTDTPEPTPTVPTPTNTPVPIPTDTVEPTLTDTVAPTSTPTPTPEPALLLSTPTVGSKVTSTPSVQPTEVQIPTVEAPNVAATSTPPPIRITRTATF